MPMDSVENLLGILQRMQVMTPQEVEEIARELSPCFSDPLDLARYLVEVDWLTDYQVDLLFGERWEELRIGPYLILDRLGEGGVSEVFRAWDTVKGHQVALKVMRQNLTDRTAAAREFQRELQAVTRLAHPNVIQIHDAQRIGELHYFAMEYVEGLDLDRHVRRTGPLPLDRACEYIRQVALGLQHAHQVGLVHRDIKPANLFLVKPPDRRGSDALVKILDWGLARVRLEGGGETDGAGIDRDIEKGMLIGTADYIAPEQARDPCLVDIRADIYSLGCTLYFLLTGEPPFRGASLMQKLLQHRDAERPKVREARPDVPEELAAVVQRMMARQPEERYPIPLLVAGALRHFAHGATGRPGWPSSNALSSGSSSNLGTCKPATMIALSSEGVQN